MKVILKTEILGTFPPNVIIFDYFLYDEISITKTLIVIVKHSLESEIN
jgi:hypothetical protein